MLKNLLYKKRDMSALENASTHEEPDKAESSKLVLEKELKDSHVSYSDSKTTNVSSNESSEKSIQSVIEKSGPTLLNEKIAESSEKLSKEDILKEVCSDVDGNSSFGTSPSVEKESQKSVSDEQKSAESVSPAKESQVPVSVKSDLSPSPPHLSHKNRSKLLKNLLYKRKDTDALKISPALDKTESSEVALKKYLHVLNSDSKATDNNLSFENSDKDFQSTVKKSDQILLDEMNSESSKKLLKEEISKEMCTGPDNVLIHALDKNEVSKTVIKGSFGTSPSMEKESQKSVSDEKMSVESVSPIKESQVPVSVKPDCTPSLPHPIHKNRSKMLKNLLYKKRGTDALENTTTHQELDKTEPSEVILEKELKDLPVSNSDSKTTDNVSSDENSDRDFQAAAQKSDQILLNEMIAESSEKLSKEDLKDVYSDPDDLLTYALDKNGDTKSDDNSALPNVNVQVEPQVMEVEAKAVDFSSKSLWEEQKVPALQIGLAVPTPMLSIDDAFFHPNLVKILHSVKLEGPSCIQSVVWPAMKKNRNIIAIAAPHSGKTISYLLPLIDNFHDGIYGKLTKGVGPIVIILCSSWKKVQAVYSFTQLFLGKTKVKILTLINDGGSRKNKLVELMNGCDILISSPSCMLQLFEGNAVSFSRCHHFILDDGSYLISYHKKELKTILLHFVNCCKEENCIPQLVLCAERWSRPFSYIMDKLMRNPLLLFTSFLESAIYAQVPIFAHVCKSSDKKQMLHSILKNGKTVICTTSTEEATEVHKFLICENVKSYLVHEEMEHYISNEKIKDWKYMQSSASPNCLVITDAGLMSKSISNADFLVHYDVPKESRFQFGNRFSLIAEHFKSKEIKCACHIIVTEEASAQAHQLIDIIESAGGTVPDELKKLAEEQQTVTENPTAPLCPYLKAFGSCNVVHCEQRHSISSELDKPAVITTEGDIQAFVSHVVDASHFYVRILKYILPDSKECISLSAAYAQIGFQLRHFYSSDENKKIVQSVQVGSVYVTELENVFYRVKVLHLTSMAHGNLQLKLLFIDEGWIRFYEKCKLFLLPESLDLPAPQFAEVYVCHIKPPDSCWDWNPQTSQFVSNIVKGVEICGKIKLCIGETLWLHPIVIREKLHLLNEYLNVLKLHTAVKNAGYAVENKSHLNLLYKVCEDKIPIPRIVVDQKEKPEKENYSISKDVSYAFLECGIYEDVYVSSVVTPHQLYVQRVKFADCLDDVQDVINAGIQKKLLPKCTTFYQGMHCIALFREDNRYYRAVITNIISDDEVNLFYVDFGDTDSIPKDEIYVLPPELMLLPFQAIECELTGISAAHGGWTEEICDILYSLTRDASTEMKYLQLKAYSKTPRYGGGNHYIVDIWDGEKSFSDQLLQTGLVNPSETAIAVDGCSGDKPSDQIPDVPEGFSITEEEDLHPDEKDAAALFCGVLSKLMLKACEMSKDCPVIEEVTSHDESLSDCINSLSNKTVMPCAQKDRSESLPALNEKLLRMPVQNQASLVSPMKMSESTSECKPLVIWWDNCQVLHVAVKLRDLQNYDLDLSDEIFSFQAHLRGTNYKLQEELYSSICSSEAKHYVTSQSLNIVAYKKEYVKWPRFTKEKRKFLHIKYDLDHLDDSDTENDHPPTEEPCKNVEDEIAPYPSDDTESSTDDDETYVQPWKELAQYKDPFNPHD